MFRVIAAWLILAFSAGQSDARESYLNAEVRGGIAIAAEACARYLKKGDNPAWLAEEGFSESGKQAWTARFKNKSTLGRQRVSVILGKKGICYVNLSHVGRPEAKELGDITLQRIRAEGFRDVQSTGNNQNLARTYLVAGVVKLDYSLGIQTVGGASYAVVSLSPVQE